MKLKSLVVVTLLVLGCSAAFGQSYSFGFLNYTGGVQYCENENFTVYGGFFATGTQDLSNCGVTDGTLVGWKTSIAAKDGLAISGSGYAMASTELDQFCDCNSGTALNWFTKLKISKHNKLYGWILLESTGGVLSYDNIGYLTTPLAEAKGANHASAAHQSKK